MDTVWGERVMTLDTLQRTTRTSRLRQEAPRDFTTPTLAAPPICSAAFLYSPGEFPALTPGAPLEMVPSRGKKLLLCGPGLDVILPWLPRVELWKAALIRNNKTSEPSLSDLGNQEPR